MGILRIGAGLAVEIEHLAPGEAGILYAAVVEYSPNYRAHAHGARGGLLILKIGALFFDYIERFFY